MNENTAGIGGVFNPLINCDVWGVGVWGIIAIASTGVPTKCVGGNIMRMRDLGQWFWRSDEGTISLENVGFAISATVLIGAVVVVTGNTILTDTEERMHIINAQAMVDGVKTILSETNEGPDLNLNTTYTLERLYLEDRVAPAVDPSSATNDQYHSLESIVLVQNVLDETLATGSRTVNKFYVKLVRLDGEYAYVDMTDTTDDIEDRVVAGDLRRSDILVPKRDDEGH